MKTIAMGNRKTIQMIVWMNSWIWWTVKQLRIVISYLSVNTNNVWIDINSILFLRNTIK